MPKRRLEADNDGLEATQADKKVKEKKVAVESLSTQQGVDKISNRQKKKQKKLEDKANRKKPLDESKRDERNRLLREQGKPTRSAKYKARLAALKSQALAEKTAKSAAGKLGAARLEAEALAAAGLEAMDPARTECFITGLNYMSTEHNIAEHFAAVGSCKVSILKDDSKGRSSGKAFVTFDSAEKALKACTYNATKLQKRWINIRLCEPRGGASKDAAAGPGERPEGCLTAVAKCDTSTSEASLWKFFEDCQVSGVKRFMDRETGDFTGQVFLDFEDGSFVDMAVKKNGKTIKGKPIQLRYKR